MKASEVKGVTAVRPERKRKEPVEYNENNLHISKDQFIANRKAEKAAAQEMAEAEAGIKAKYGLKLTAQDAQPIERKAPPAKDNGDLDAKLADARKKLVEAEGKLKAKPESQHFNKLVRDLNAEVERIENIIE